MDRRSFIRHSAGSGIAMGVVPWNGLLPTQPGRSPTSATRAVGTVESAGRDPRALIMDAMGELRTIYEPALVKQMLASGMIPSRSPSAIRNPSGPRRSS
ncbi:MAG: hypothetical protein OEU54_16395 [Gemmatimonadota bacterium]|nr:hypothetical protein [Gemmatimonadota bacterium]